MERRAVVCRERLLLGHCLILSVLVVRASKIQIINFIFFDLVYLFALNSHMNEVLCRTLITCKDSRAPDNLKHFHKK